MEGRSGGSREGITITSYINSAYALHPNISLSHTQTQNRRNHVWFVFRDRPVAAPIAAVTFTSPMQPRLSVHTNTHTDTHLITHIHPILSGEQEQQRTRRMNTDSWINCLGYSVLSLQTACHVCYCVYVCVCVCNCNMTAQDLGAG